MRRIKIVIRLAVVLFLVVVAVGAAGIAILVAVDRDEIREFLAAQVRDATGRELVIKGDLDLAISLSPAVVAGDVTFANAEWGSGPHMVSLKRLEVGLELIPLLKSEIKFTKILLIEPNILLERDAQGRANWEFAAKPSEDKPGAVSGDSAAPVIPQLQLVEFQNASFTFKDQAAGRKFDIRVKRMSLDGNDPSGKLKIRLDGAYAGTAFAIDGALGALAELAANPASYPVDLKISALGAAFNIKGNIGRPLGAPNFDMGFAAKGDDLTATVNSAKTLVPGAGLPPIPKIGGFEASGRILGAPADPSIKELKFSVGTAGYFNITGGGEIAGITASPKINLSVALKGSDLRPFSKLAGARLPKAPDYSIGAALEIRQDGIEAKNIAIPLGGTDLKGDASVSLNRRIPGIRANLASDRLDLNDILAALPEAKAGKAPKPDSRRLFPDDPLPLDALKSVNAQLKFKGKQILAGPAPIDDLDLTIKLNNGNLSVAPATARISGGQLGARVSLNGAVKSPRLEVSLDVKGLDLGGLLKQMQLTDILSGKLDAKVKLNGAGTSVRKIMAALNGNTELVMNQGRIESKYVDLLAADLISNIMPWADQAKDTKINCLVSRFHIKRGIAKSTGLLFDTEKMTISGGGQIDLRDEKLDMRIKPEAKDASLVSLSVPIDIGGTLKSPAVAPSTAAVVKGVAGLALTAINPVALLALTVSGGAGDKNPCVAALEKAKSGAAKPQAAEKPKSDNPIESITKGVGGALKSLFGGN